MFRKSKIALLLVALLLMTSIAGFAAQSGYTDKIMDYGVTYRYGVEDIFIDVPSNATAAATCNNIVSAGDISTTSPYTLTLLAQPDTPRNLACVIYDSDGATTIGLKVSFLVTGYNQFGQAKTETIVAENTTTTTYTLKQGYIAFAKITSIVATSTNNAASDLVYVGVGGKFGFTRRIGTSGTDLFKVTFNGVNEEVGTVSTAYNTYVPSTIAHSANPEDMSYEELYVHVADDATAAATCDSLVAGVDISTTSPYSLTITLQPDVPRNLAYCIKDATPSGTALSVVYLATGKNQFGQTITESITVANATTTTYTLTLGSKIFATVTSVVATMTNPNAGDLAYVGFGSQIGFTRRIYSAASIFKATFNGANETVAAPDVTYFSYNPTTALDGTDTVRLWFLPRDHIRLFIKSTNRRIAP